MLIAGGSTNIVWTALNPARGRLVPVEIAILLARKQIHARCLSTSQVLEVTARRGVAVDAADAAEAREEVADFRTPLVEALGTAAKPAEKMKVIDIDLEWLNLHQASASAISWASSASETTLDCGMLGTFTPVSSAMVSDMPTYWTP
ncbi:hypothetical protein CO675_11820 [Bradyrhizobium sp. C9]|nr:hypothetical protein CO675_11820 [Bradyrhizobium sp. C9]